MPSLMKSLTLVTTALLLAGCASNSQTSQASSQEIRRPAPVATVPVRRHQPDDLRNPMGTQTPQPQPSGNAAVNSLLQQAAQARASGDLARAQTLAERAQSLAPRDAACYLELSRIYQQRGDQARARQMALRGLSVGGDDPAMRDQLERLSIP